MSYREKLHPWAVVQLLPKMQRVVRGRFCNASNADGYLRALRQCIPEGDFIMVFDPPVLTVAGELERL